MIQGFDFDLEKEGFDKYLRHILSPVVKTQPLTLRDVFNGERTTYFQSNIQPRSIGRFNLAMNVILPKMDWSLTNVKQVATGYDFSLNNFIYVATWDGTNYYLRRYNAVDFDVPSQDGFSVNIPTVNNIFGVGILYDRVVVIGSDSGGNKAFYYDFYLNYQSAETKTAPTNPITSQFVSDGVNLYWLDSTNNVLRKYDGKTYTLLASYSWPTTQYSPTPSRLLAIDRKSFWAYDPTNKKIVRFQLNESAPSNQITVLYSYLFPEDVLGIMYFRGNVYLSYQNGQLLTTIPFNG